MSQMNLHITPEFEADLEVVMKSRGLRSKSEAVRLAVHEMAAQHAGPKKWDLAPLIGLIDRYPGGRQDPRTGEELLAEIDAEMEAKLERLARGK